LRISLEFALDCLDNFHRYIMPYARKEDKWQFLPRINPWACLPELL
jgi:hypothetical protein